MKKSILSKEYLIRFAQSMKKGQFLLILIFFLSFIQFGFATDYYVSSSSGNDSRSSSEAQNSATPWKSIEKLNSVSSIFKGGDRIFFKTGDVFYGTINITRSGSTGAPILFSSYGTGAKPIITSLVEVQNWVSIGSGIYQADLSAYNLSRVQIVLINDQIKEVGRYPNAGTTNGGYLKIASVNTNTSFNTSSSNPFTGSVGEVVIRKNNWIIDRHQIESISGSTISFKPNESVYHPQKDLGYFLQNHVSLLDNSGEWSYDPTSKKLAVNLSGYDVNSVKVMVSTLDNLVTNSAYTTNLSFSNLHFKGSNLHLLNISRSENVKIENCILDYAGENAIHSFDVKGLVIQNNQINHALTSGIFLRYGTPGAIIRENFIQNSMPFQGMSRSSDLSGIGIYLASDGDGSLIEKNKVINTGYNGIHFGGSYSKVTNNLVDTFCVFKQDGGGIYMNSDGFRDRNNIGREIIGNIVLNGIGTKQGTHEDIEIAEGIYLDDNTAGVKVSKNTIAKVSGKGIFLHNANNIQINENLFYKTKSQVQFTHDHLGDPIRSVSIAQNQFSSMGITEQVYSLYSKLDDIGSVGTINNNYFLDPFNTDFFIRTKGSSDPQGIDRNLTNWASSFGYDVNAVSPDLNLSTVKVNSSTLLKESTFGSNTSIIAGVYGATSQWVSSGISGGSAKITNSSTNSATVYIQIGAIQTNEKILVEFDMKGTVADIPVELFLENTFNIDKGVGNGKVSTATTAKSYQVFLSSLTSKSSESVVFRIPTSAKELLLDNLKISKVSTEEIDKESLIFFAYNPTGSAVTEPLNGTYVNAKNETFSGSVTIPSYGSVLLAKTSTVSEPIPNQAPTISLSKPTEGQTFTLGSDVIELVANAQDPEGKIKQVEFYNGTTLLATVTKAPYSYIWTDILGGNYQVTAKVIDEGNLSTTSAPVQFSVKEPGLTYIMAMISPVNNSTFELGSQQVVLKTNATTSGLTIQKVEYFNWGNPLVTVTSGNFEYNWTTIEVGNYSVQAKVTDSKGTVFTTDIVKFTVTAPAVNQAPTVSISKPTEGQTFTLGVDPIELVANGQDPEGKIKQVEFYNGTTLLATVTTAPFSYSWANIPAGNYQVTAKVIDEGNLSATSAAVNFSVKEQTVNYTAQMVSPVNNSTFELGSQQVVLKTNAATSGLTIQKVEYFNWGFPLITVSSGNFEFNWTAIEADNYSIQAKVTDNKGVVYTTDVVKFTVTAPAGNQAPTVSLSNPTEGQTFTIGVDQVQLAANAQDPEGKIKQVEFYNGTSLLATVSTAPFSYNWANIPAGNYQVTAKVIDEGNLSATSTTVNFSVKEQTVNYNAQMVSPVNNSSFELGSQQVVLKTNAATSGLTIQKVEYFNWGFPLITVSSGNFEYNWASIEADNYSIQAKVTDNKGVVYTTDVVKFTVTAPAVNQAPTVSLSKPTEGQTFTIGVDQVQLAANAQDPEGKIKQVEFYNGTTLLATVTTAPYSYNWANISAGNYQVSAKVIDEGNLSATSAAVNFSVKEQTVNYTAQMVSPINNSSIELGSQQVVLKTNAATSGLTIQKVEYFNWGNPIVTVTSGTFEFNWTAIEEGNYSVQAKVTDNKGNIYTTDVVKFTVTAPVVNQAPTVSLSKPTEGQTFTIGVDQVQLAANAQDPEGKIKQVEFYNGSALLATVTTAPYSYNWTNIPAGNYQVTAKVIDEGNLSATSAAVNFSVKEQTVNYTALMVSPINNSNFELGSQQVVLKTNAATSGLTIQKVEYFNWGNPLTSVISGNFEYIWSSIEAGSYSVQAKVTDSKGTVFTTDVVKFAVTATNTLSINVVQPYENQIFTLGKETVKLKADVSSPTSIKSVKFYNWGSLVSTDNSFPYELDWRKIKAGDYQVHAVVTDASGKTATSKAVKFKVNSSNSNAETTDTGETVTAATTLEISQPYDNQVFELGKDTVVLLANTSEKVGKVEFFNWYTPLATITNDKKEFLWANIEAGEYFVSARITDSKGNVIDSAPIRFKVVESNTKPAEEEKNDPVTTAPISDSLTYESKEPAELDKKNSKGYGIKMGPNPTSSHLNIYFNDYPQNMEGNVSVLDLRGVELYRSDFNTNQETATLDLSFLKPGIYVVKLNFGDKIFQSHKLVKE